jgi:hypothetical protein
MSVPQTLLLLTSKLAQVKGYAEGMQEGFRMTHPETLDTALLCEHINKGIDHLNKLIDEARKIEGELRLNLRARGEEC